MAPLSPGQVHELLETCDRLSREREALVAIVTELPSTFSSLRTALNSIHRLLAGEQDRAGEDSNHGRRRRE